MGPIYVDLNILHFHVTDTDEMECAAKSSRAEVNKPIDRTELEDGPMRNREWLNTNEVWRSMQNGPR